MYMTYYKLWRLGSPSSVVQKMETQDGRWCGCSSKARELGALRAREVQAIRQRANSFLCLLFYPDPKRIG